MASNEEFDEKCLQKYGFDLRETYKVTVKFYKGMKMNHLKKSVIHFKKSCAQKISPN